MSPALQHCVPQQVVPAPHVCPLHGTCVHLPCWQNGVPPVHTTPHPPQLFGSLYSSTSQLTPLQQMFPGMHVGHCPPPELLPLDEPLPDPELEAPLLLPDPPPEPLLDALPELPPDPPELPLEPPEPPELPVEPLPDPVSRAPSVEASPPTTAVEPPQ
jgi:hypothetical protein